MKWVKIDYQLTKLGIRSEELKDLILTRLDSIHNMSRLQGTGKGNPKLGVKLP
jgi:hypothetical protein